MPDYTKLQYFSGANTFKNTNVKTATLTLSGSVGAGVEVTTQTAVTLTENQVFVFAAAEYTEFVRGGTATYQQLPTFDALVNSSGGAMSAYILARVNGTTVTFIAGLKNPLGVSITLTSTTFNIKYVTYTLAK